MNLEKYWDRSFIKGLEFEGFGMLKDSYLGENSASLIL